MLHRAKIYHPAFRVYIHQISEIMPELLPGAIERLLAVYRKNAGDYANKEIFCEPCWRYHKQIKPGLEGRAASDMPCPPSCPEYCDKHLQMKLTPLQE